MPIPSAPRHRPDPSQSPSRFQNKISSKSKYKPKPRSNTKHKPKPKQTRAARSRNWRSRPHTPISSTEYIGRHCECGCRSGYRYEYEWSEDSIQRQLSYLIPIPSPLGPFEEQGVWGEGSEESNEERGPCCWHQIPFWGREGEGEGQSAVWCCGGMCAYLAIAHASYLALSPASEEDAEMPGLGDGSESAGGSEVEQVESGVDGDGEGMEGEGGRRMLFRDEWECDFCGSECFCGYQAFATQNSNDAPEGLRGLKAK